MSERLDMLSDPGIPPVTTADSLTADQPGAAEGAEKARILIVDDDNRNLMALKLILEDLGEELIFARSGEEALRYLLHHDCALILMDVLMPNMDGYEATRRIKSMPTIRHVPVIAVTSYALSGDDVKALRAGCDAYVTKPFSPRALLATVKQYLEPETA